jgi:nucleotide-binding universal stress UspA family protein
MMPGTRDEAGHQVTTLLRVVVAVHGYEPEGWARDAARVVSLWNRAWLRVLAVRDVPAPPRTSLIGERMYRAAQAEWARQDDVRLRPHLGALTAVLPRDAEITEVTAIRGSVPRTIAAHAEAWEADVVVVGAPARGLRTHLWPGPVHEQLLRCASCAVLVTPAVPDTTHRRPRLAVVPQSAAAQGA